MVVAVRWRFSIEFDDKKSTALVSIFSFLLLLVCCIFSFSFCRCCSSSHVLSFFLFMKTYTYKLIHQIHQLTSSSLTEINKTSKDIFYCVKTFSFFSLSQIYPGKVLIYSHTHTHLLFYSIYLQWTFFVFFQTICVYIYISRCLYLKNDTRSFFVLCVREIKSMISMSIHSFFSFCHFRYDT